MQKRNVVVFVCDQLRPDFLTAYGCDAIDTPAIDWIAANGVTFDRAITQSTVCGPARASMQTGRYVSDHGAWTNDVPWREGMETLGERMTNAGYRTGCFGKMHHVPALDPKGFETAAFFEEGRLGDDEPYLVWLRERHPEVSSSFVHRDLKSLVSEDEHYETWIAERALDFLGDRDDRPFLAWISFQGPHNPYDPVEGMETSVRRHSLPAAVDPERSNDSPYVRNRAAWNEVPSDPAGRDRYRAAYAEMIAQIDRQIARVLAALDEAGELEHTTIVFTADHGDEQGDHGVDTKGPWPFRSQLQIPLIVANDPRVGRGFATDALVGNIDVAATLLDVAGEERGIGTSRSLIDLAQPEPRAPRDHVFCEFMDHMKLVEARDFRLAYFPFLDRTELYDLRVDRDCLVNLAGTPEHAAVELELMRRLVDHGAMCRGPLVNAFDLVPEMQVGLRNMHPRFEEEMPIAFPLSPHQRQLLLAAGLDASFNEFCKGRDVLAHYGLYWESGPTIFQGMVATAAGA